MPYSSRAQGRKFHALLAEGKISAATVKEYDDATDFSKLPERKSPMKEEKESPKMSRKDKLHEVAESAMMGKKKKKMPMDKLDKVKMGFMMKGVKS